MKLRSVRDFLNDVEAGNQVTLHRPEVQYLRLVKAFYGTHDIEYLRKYVAFVAQATSSSVSSLMSGTMDALIHAASQAAETLAG